MSCLLCSQISNYSLSGSDALGGNIVIRSVLNFNGQIKLASGQPICG